MPAKQKLTKDPPITDVASLASIARTPVELTWADKDQASSPLPIPKAQSLPFQRVEVVTPETKSVLPLARTSRIRNKKAVGATDLNKLIWGDNLHVEASLRRAFAGKIDLIYIDPPFNIGADFTYKANIGDGDTTVEKKASILELKAYRDTWAGGLSSYLSMIAPRLELMRELLSPTGSLYIHLDPTVSHYVKVLADEIFGYDCFQREIVWRIGWLSGYKTKAQNWIRNHDSILYYTRDKKSFTFNKDYLPYPKDYKRRDGKIPTGKGSPLDDVWNGNDVEASLSGPDSLDSIQIKSFSNEKTGYATQKNESILRRIINASSNPGDLVADFFCGSGTTLVVAEKLGRRWIGCDLGKFAIHVSRKRLLDLAATTVKNSTEKKIEPFEILNIGRYERQHWHLQNFPGKFPVDETAADEYLDFILRLYGAERNNDSSLHGRKGEALVYVGSVDSPIQAEDVKFAIEQASKHRSREVHVLGWDFQMGLNDPIIEKGLAKFKVKTRLLTIPREIMDLDDPRQSEVVFLDLAYLDAVAELKRGPERAIEVKVLLKDFATSSSSLLPEKLRSSIKKWSDYIDYWAIDWDFDGNCFYSQWHTFRTLKQRELTLISPPHTYVRGDVGDICVKVVDIFGNDTSHIIKGRAP